MYNKKDKYYTSFLNNLADTCRWLLETVQDSMSYFVFL